DRVDVPNNELFRRAKCDKNIAAFLSFSPIFYWEQTTYKYFTEIRFIDLRYRSKGYYPFVAVVHIDHDFQILSSYTGWIFSEHKLQTKLHTTNKQYTKTLKTE